jgi:hypothetical protein
MLDSATSDATGWVRFPTLPGGGDERFEAQSGTSMGWDEAWGRDSFGVVLGAARWTELRFGDGAPREVWAVRTSLRAAVTGGVARMLLPRGVPTGIAGVDSGALRPAGTSTGLSDSVRLRWDRERFLVADFDGDLSRTLPGALVGGGWWYASNDSFTGGGSRFLPLGVEADLQLAQAPAESSWSGRSLRLVYDADTTFEARFLTTGFLFGASGTSTRNLSCLDSVAFMARGSGSFVLKTQLPPGSEGVQKGTTFDAPSDWTRMAIPASGFLGADAPPSILQRLTGLQFLSTDSGELWLDDIELVGCRPEEVYPELGP